VAFRYSGNFTYNAKQPIEAGFLPRTDLIVPNTFTVMVQGALGRHCLSGWTTTSRRVETTRLRGWTTDT